jgi:hypothetical protein
MSMRREFSAGMGPGEREGAMRSILFVAWLAFAAAGCQCLPVPTSDSTPPETHIYVEFVDGAGVAQSRNLPYTASPCSIVVKAGSRISVRFSSHDPQGVKKVQLAGEVRSQTSNSVSIGTIAGESATNGCPRESIFQVQELGAPLANETMKISALGTNWLDGISQSPEVTITSTP